MTTGRPTAFNEQISHEAGEWFVEFRTAGLDPAARRSFVEWLRASPEHLRAYLEIAAIWNQGSALDAGRELDVDRLIARAREPDNVIPMIADLQEAQAERAEVARVRVKNGFGAPRRRLAVAASIAATVCLVAAIGWLHSRSVPSYSTGIGEQRSILLEDGSTVELNSRSQVRVRFSDEARIVDLVSGQALFAVAKDPERAFFVRSGSAQVRAVGTQFDVYRKSKGTVVTVLEGRVAASVGAPDDSRVLQQPILLSAGEQVTMSTHAAPRAVRANVAVATAWTQRQLVFESASLEEVAEEFNRYSARRLVVQGPAPADFHLSGVFSSNDPGFLIHFLRARADIAVHETDSEIRIVRHER